MCCAEFFPDCLTYINIITAARAYPVRGTNLCVSELPNEDFQHLTRPAVSDERKIGLPHFLFL